MTTGPTVHLMSKEAQAALLFVPADDRSKTGKIASVDADGFILDLEDAVAVAHKELARQRATQLIGQLADRTRLWVRVNPVDSTHHVADVEAVTVPGLAGVVLPKATSADQLRDLDNRMAALERARGMDAPVPVSPTIENARGLHAIDEIACSAARVCFLGLGAGDLALDVGIDWPHDMVDHPVVTQARVRLVFASRVAGLSGPHDGAHPRHRDLEGLRAQAVFARSLGFATKHLIHPAQVPVVREVFAATATEIARAQRIVDAFEVAERRGHAAISVDDTLVDYPVYQRALAVLQTAEPDASDK